MKIGQVSLAALTAIALLGGVSAARADSAEAVCQVRKDGETKQGMSGPCTFSQRQGYIDIDLRNGETISLSPGNKANHFKDQKGNKVMRTQAGGNTQEYKWDNGRKLTVSFSDQSSSRGGGVGSEWDRGCSDAKSGSYDRSKHSQAYEEGWQACKQQAAAPARNGGSEVSSSAKSACMVAINSNYGGKVRDLKVVRSEFSQANSEVIVDAVGVRGTSATERWKCLVSNDGKVQDLSVSGQ